MSLRDYDPETYTEQCDDHHRLLDETDRRGTRSERDLEAHVYGDDYRDRYDVEQARKAHDTAVATDLTAVVSARRAQWLAMRPEPDAEHVAIDSHFRPITVLRNACGCTWNADTGCRAGTCDVHLSMLATVEGTNR